MGWTHKLIALLTYAGFSARGKTLSPTVKNFFHVGASRQKTVRSGTTGEALGVGMRVSPGGI